jgi:hypothetical protein
LLIRGANAATAAGAFELGLETSSDMARAFENPTGNWIVAR